ncbi:hypothetical protein TNCV_4164571 [Trichonephila clavipes]|nr:hypothetical protein TNCV_4164571 [Trichonephila clavipes]
MIKRRERHEAGTTHPSFPTLTEGLLSIEQIRPLPPLNYMAGLQRYQARTHDTPATSPLQRPPMSVWKGYEERSFSWAAT